MLDPRESRILHMLNRRLFDKIINIAFTRLAFVLTLRLRMNLRCLCESGAYRLTVQSCLSSSWCFAQAQHLYPDVFPRFQQGLVRWFALENNPVPKRDPQFFIYRRNPE